MSNPLGKVITASGGRRLAIGDIHGCLESLKALIDQLKPTNNDQLFFLGDYVNKGPNGPGVIDYIIQLSSQLQVNTIFGNHDQLILNYLEGNPQPDEDHLKELRSESFIGLSKDKKTQYIKFLSDLHHYFILDNCLLVHAGFDFTLANPFLGTEAMLNIREFYYDSSKAQGKAIVHGHYPYSLDHIKQQIAEHNRIIPLDNGCVYSDREGQGNLLCLDLDTDELWVQPNID